MAYHLEMESVKDEQKVLKGEQALDLMALQLQDLFMLKNFYNNMDFAANQLVITKASLSSQFLGRLRPCSE